MRTELVALLALAVGASSAGATDLSGPIGYKPTVATEIRRGQDAADQCASLSDTPNKYVQCTDAVIARSAERTTNEPFKLGVYMSAWIAMEADVGGDEAAAEALKGFKLPKMPGEISSLDWATFVFHRMRETQARVGLTDVQLEAVADKFMFGPGVFKQRLGFYEARVRQPAK